MTSIGWLVSAAGGITSIGWLASWGGEAVGADSCATAGATSKFCLSADWEGLVSAAAASVGLLFAFVSFGAAVAGAAEADDSRVSSTPPVSWRRVEGDFDSTTEGKARREEWQALDGNPTQQRISSRVREMPIPTREIAKAKKLNKLRIILILLITVRSEGFSLDPF
jgi:hypothetical protein